MSGRVQFVCDGEQVEVDAAPGETLLSVLRERLGHHEREGRLRAAGPVRLLHRPGRRRRPGGVRHAGRPGSPAGRSRPSTGSPPAERDALAAAFVATGGSQCGFCTPGIIVRAAALRAKGAVDAGRRRPRARRAPLPVHRLADRRSTRSSAPAPAPRRRAVARRGARERAALEGGVRAAGRRATSRSATAGSPTTPRRATRSSRCRSRRAATRRASRRPGIQWVSRESLLEARELAGKVQGRRTTVDAAPPLPLPAAPRRRRAARDELGRARVPRARRVVVRSRAASRRARSQRRRVRRQGDLAGRRGGARARRPPRPAGADAVLARGRRAARPEAPAVRGERGAARRDVCASRACARARCATSTSTPPSYLGLSSSRSSRRAPRWSARRRRAPHAPPGFAELRVLQEGALDAAGLRPRRAPADRRARRGVPRQRRVDSGRRRAAPARASSIDPTTGALERVEVRVAAGDPLDEVVLRSYAIGAAHMALGWVLTEGLAVDPETGEVHDLTIRSFGVIRAKDTPPIDVTIVDDPGPPLAAVVRRGVRRGRGGDVERARPAAEGDAARDVPRPRHPRPPVCSAT